MKQKDILLWVISVGALVISILALIQPRINPQFSNAMGVSGGTYNSSTPTICWIEFANGPAIGEYGTDSKGAYCKYDGVKYRGVDIHKGAPLVESNY